MASRSPPLIEERWERRVGKDDDRPAPPLLARGRESAGPRPPRLPPDPRVRAREQGPARPRRRAAERPAADLSLADLLSRVLLAFALEYERESNVSLAIGANVLRVLDDPAVRVRDLPRLSGVSKEAISVALGFLEKRRLAVVEPDPAGDAGRSCG